MKNKKTFGLLLSTVCIGVVVVGVVFAVVELKKQIEFEVDDDDILLP